MSTMPPTGFRTSTETAIKKSRFITTVARVDDEAAARAVITEVRGRYPDARHHATAFLLDDAGVRLTRSSDGGEPAGTAGVPILHSLTQAGLVNIVAVVTRYFGGIKLGAGGLARAYGGCVADAVANVPRVTQVVREVWRAQVPYADAGRIQEELLRAGVTLLDSTYTQDATQLTMVFPDGPVATLSRVTHGVLSLTPAGQHIDEVPVNL